MHVEMLWAGCGGSGAGRGIITACDWAAAGLVIMPMMMMIVKHKFERSL